jgi:hypothetical protein
MGLNWAGGGNRLMPQGTQTFGRVAQPMINVFFPGQYESPINRYDWSHYLGWLIRETD